MCVAGKPRWEGPTRKKKSAAEGVSSASVATPRGRAQSFGETGERLSGRGCRLAGLLALHTLSRAPAAEAAQSCETRWPAVFAGDVRRYFASQASFSAAPFSLRIVQPAPARLSGPSHALGSEPGWGELTDQTAFNSSSSYPTKKGFVGRGGSSLQNVYQGDQAQSRQGAGNDACAAVLGKAKSLRDARADKHICPPQEQ